MQVAPQVDDGNAGRAGVDGGGEGGEGDGGGGVGGGEAEYDEPGPDERQARAQQMQEAVQNMPIEI